MNTNFVPLHRRLIGMIYDFLLAGTLILLVAFALAGTLNAMNIQNEPNSLLSNLIFALYLTLGFVYMAWFSLKKSQTPGMWVWKHKIANLSGDKVTLLQVLVRYIALMAILLAGFLIGYKLLNLSSMASTGSAILLVFGSLLFSRFNPEKLTLHEYISKTRLIDLRQ